MKYGRFLLASVLLTITVSCSQIVDLGLELITASFMTVSGNGAGRDSSTQVDPNTRVLSINRDSLVFHTMENSDTLILENLLDDGMSFTITGEQKGDPVFSNLVFPGLKSDGNGCLYDILSSKEIKKIPVIVKDRTVVSNRVGKIIIHPGGEYISSLEVPVRIETTKRDLTVSVVGKVTDEAGVPYENVVVSMCSAPNFNANVFTKTDSYGSFVFDGLTPGQDLTFAIVSNYWQPQDVKVDALEKGGTGVCNFTLKRLQHHLVVDKTELNFGQIKKDDPSRTETITISVNDNYVSGFWITICNMGEPGLVGTDIQSGGLVGKGVKVNVTLTPAAGAPGPHQQLLFITSSNDTGNMLIPANYTIVE